MADELICIFEDEMRRQEVVKEKSGIDSVNSTSMSDAVILRYLTPPNLHPTSRG